MSLISAIIKLHNKLSQKSVFEVDDGITSCDEIRELCRKVTAEGCVLLKKRRYFTAWQPAIRTFRKMPDQYFLRWVRKWRRCKAAVQSVYS